MIVRYRVIEKWWEEERRWGPWGALYENCSDGFADRKVLFRTIPDEHKSVRHHFDRRIKELRIGLLDGERILGDYADRFRLRPEVHMVKGDTHEEIRQRLWECLFPSPELETEKTITKPATAWEEYTVQPAYRMIRETPGEAEEG
jgi:hypothetical protein